MSTRKKIQKEIDKKLQENQSLEEKIRENNIYIQVWTETLKLLPKDIEESSEFPKQLRHGSDLEKVQNIILKHGKPLHISDILLHLGKDPMDKKAKTSLTGSLGSYVRNKTIFTKPGPNIFGLVSFEKSTDNMEELMKTILS